MQHGQMSIFLLNVTCFSTNFAPKATAPDAPTDPMPCPEKPTSSFNNFLSLKIHFKFLSEFLMDMQMCNVEKYEVF